MFFSWNFLTQKDGSFHVNIIRKAVLTIRFTTQSIHLREKNIAGPTEANAYALLAREKDLRFSEDDVWGIPTQPFPSLVKRTVRESS